MVTVSVSLSRGPEFESTWCQGFFSSSIDGRVFLIRSLLAVFPMITIAVLPEVEQFKYSQIEDKKYLVYGVIE